MKTYQQFKFNCWTCLSQRTFLEMNFAEKLPGFLSSVHFLRFGSYYASAYFPTALLWHSKATSIDDSRDQKLHKIFGINETSSLEDTTISKLEDSCKIEHNSITFSIHVVRSAPSETINPVNNHCHCRIKLFHFNFQCLFVSVAVKNASRLLAYYSTKLILIFKDKDVTK